MPDYLLLMHDDGDPNTSDADWAPYLAGLQASGRFEGGSAIGHGVCVRKVGAVSPLSHHLTGFIRISAESLRDAEASVSGNPVYEAGGTIEIRELPRTG